MRRNRYDKIPWMKICCLFLYLLRTGSLFAQAPARSPVVPIARVVVLTLSPESVTVVHLRSGYVSAIRVPEEVSSVVLGNPKDFAAEHSDAEVRLVFLKPLLPKPGETNVLITTKSGQEVPLRLISDGGNEIDFFVDFQRPRSSFLISPPMPSSLVAETKPMDSEVSGSISTHTETTNIVDTEMLKQAEIADPKWQGKELQVAVGEMSESDHRTVVRFSVLNNSDGPVELLPPQIQLLGRANQNGKPAKAEQVGVDAYGLTHRKLAPGQRADGVLLFERPSFKESNERLLLQITRAEAVDLPVLVPIPFTPAAQETAQ